MPFNLISRSCSYPKMIDFQIQLLYNRVMLNFNSVKNKIILLIFSFIIFNVIEYYGGDFVVGLVNNVPTGAPMSINGTSFSKHSF